MKKCPSSVRCRDSNSRPLEHESPRITTRPGAHAQVVFIFSLLCLFTGHCAVSIHSRLWIWSGRDGYRKAWNNQVRLLNSSWSIIHTSVILSPTHCGNYIVKHYYPLTFLFRFAAKICGFLRQTNPWPQVESSSCVLLPTHSKFAGEVFQRPMRISYRFVVYKHSTFVSSLGNVFMHFEPDV